MIRWFNHLVMGWLGGLLAVATVGPPVAVMLWLSLPFIVFTLAALVIGYAGWWQRWTCHRGPVIDPDWSEFYRTASRFSSFAESPYDWECEGGR